MQSDFAAYDLAKVDHGGAKERVDLSVGLHKERFSLPRTFFQGQSVESFAVMSQS